MYRWAIEEKYHWDNELSDSNKALVMEKDGHLDNLNVGKWIKVFNKKEKEVGEILLRFSLDVCRFGARNYKYPHARAGADGINVFEQSERQCWEEHEGVGENEGSKYFYNPYSGKTVWEEPVGYIDRVKLAKIKAAKEKDLLEHGLMKEVMEGAGFDNEDDMEVSEGLPQVFKKESCDTMDDLLEVSGGRSRARGKPSARKAERAKSRAQRTRGVSGSPPTQNLSYSTPRKTTTIN